jgi:hypothetical protein
MAENEVVPPPLTDNERKVLGWCKEALEEGEAFLRSQKGYNLIPETIAAVMSESRSMRSSSLSSTTVNHVAKVAVDQASLCTDVKPFWEYKSHNQRYKQHVEMLGKLSEHWWLNRKIDMQHLGTVQYALAAGTGFIRQYYDTGMEDLYATAEDPRDVLPIRPPSTSLSIQDCMGVVHRVTRTVNYLRAMYPGKANRITADRDGSAITTLQNTRVGDLWNKFGSPFKQYLFGSKPMKDLPRIPQVDLYTVYIKDPSIHKGHTPLKMGEFDPFGKPLNNWSYEVPPGSRIYPRGRCITFTSNAVLYDGPNVYWHGLFPFAKLTLDPWPWTWLGKAPLWDILPIQESLNRMMRVIDDYVEKVARPDIVADKNSISKSELDKIDTRRAGLKLRQNPLGGRGLEFVKPSPLPPDFMSIVEYYETKMYELPGNRDLNSLMRLNQMPSNETVEKLIENMSPSVRLRSRVLEAYMREFATMLAYNFAQFYTLPLRLTILGEAGATKEDFDFDPDTFIPDFVHASDYNDDGTPSPSAIERGPMPRYDRAREFYKQISYHIAPASLLNASEIERQMKYLQLSRAGLIDHWTLLEVLNIPNVGEPPPGAGTITERLMAEQQMMLGMNVSPVGRKASGQELPRTTVKES